MQLDSRSVSTTEIAINNLTPSGTLANYVSTAGSGELRVRVQCTRSTNFTARGDLMSIVYDAPIGPPPPDTTRAGAVERSADGDTGGRDDADDVEFDHQRERDLSLRDERGSCVRLNVKHLYDDGRDGALYDGNRAHQRRQLQLLCALSGHFGNANANPDDFTISFSVRCSGQHGAGTVERDACLGRWRWGPRRRR